MQLLTWYDCRRRLGHSLETLDYKKLSELEEEIDESMKAIRFKKVIIFVYGFGFG